MQSALKSLDYATQTETAEPARKAAISRTRSSSLSDGHSPIPDALPAKTAARSPRDAQFRFDE
jgi:hypothetical protein